VIDLRAIWIERSETKKGQDRRAVARERHGLFRCGAFAAARVRRPSIQSTRERCSDHVPPGPNAWTLNIEPPGQFRPQRGFLLTRFTFAQQCSALATPCE